MEDLKKYIFDKENPKDFKIGKALTELYKNNRTIYTLWDPYFLTAYFEDFLIDENFKSKIWSIENIKDFENLRISEKIEIYKRDFSSIEFYKVCFANIQDKNEELKRSLPKFTFISTLENTLNEEFEHQIEIGEESHITEIFENEENYEISFSWNKIVGPNFKNILNSTLENEYIHYLKSRTETKLFALTANNFHVLNYFDFSQSNYLITTNEDYKLLDEKYKSISNLKPVLLNGLEDFKQLLFAIGVKNEEAKQTKTLQKFNYLNSVKIQKFLTIKESFPLELNNLESKKEIYLLGENGVGKTIILQGILLAIIKDIYKDIKYRPDYILKYYDPQAEIFKGVANIRDYMNVFAYGVGRLRTVEKKTDNYGFSSLFGREISLTHPVDFLERTLLLHYESQNKDILPYEEVKKLFEDIIN